MNAHCACAEIKLATTYTFIKNKIIMMMHMNVYIQKSATTTTKK